MMEYLPLLNVLIIPLMIYCVKHESRHARIELLIKQICKKIDITDGG